MPETAQVRQTLRTDRMMLCLALGLFAAEAIVLTGLFWI
jgi:hypothetical protein